MPFDGSEILEDSSITLLD